MKLLFTFYLVWLGFVSCQDKAKIESLQPCKDDVDCKPNSFCYNNDLKRFGNCKCNDNFLLWRNYTAYECLLPSYHEGDCTNNIQCEFVLGSLSRCINNKCKCMEYCHFYNKKCHKTKNLGETCDQDEECRAISDQIYCVYGKCSCSYGFHEASSGKCTKTSHLGNPCESDDSCVTKNAFCHGICKCKIGFVPSNDGTLCLEAARSFGEPCIELKQCNNYLKDSECINYKCNCADGSHPYGPQCIRNAHIGQYCSKKEECMLIPEYFYSVDCKNNICTCIGGAESNIQGCVRITNSGPISFTNKLILLYLLTLFHII